MYPQEYLQFFSKFNQGQYYECHDLLEAIWLEDRQNRFLQGLLQMAVGLYHYEYGNVKGARLLFASALRYLQEYRPRFWGVDLEKVHAYLQHILDILPNEDRIPLEEARRNPLPKIELTLEE